MWRILAKHKENLKLVILVEKIDRWVGILRP